MPQTLPLWVSILLPLLGVAVGATVSLLGIMLQQRNATKHEVMRAAVKLALHDRESQMQLAQHTGVAISLPPIETFVAYHLRLMKRASQLQRITQRDLESAHEDSRAISEYAKSRRGLLGAAVTEEDP